MSTLPAVTMQDLELEHAELLPNRETLGGNMGGPPGGSSHSGSFNAFNQVNASHNGNGDGNGNGNGGGWLSPSVLSGNGNGDFNGNLSGNNVQIF